MLRSLVPRALRRWTPRLLPSLRQSPSQSRSKDYAPPSTRSSCHASPSTPRQHTRLASSFAPASPAAAAVTVLAMATVYSATVARTDLPVPDDAADKSHHVKDAGGRTRVFRNPHPSAGETHTTFGMIKKIMRARISGEFPSPSTDNHHIPQVKPTFLPTRSNTAASSGAASETGPAGGSLRATWLGHACYYVEFPTGLRVLFDPVFEQCCSPPPASWFGPKRFTPAPAEISELPFVDAVFISHSHYDHLSLPSVRAVVARHPNAHFFVGLGLEKWFRASGINNVTELDWWEDAQLRLTAAEDDAGNNQKQAPAAAAWSPREMAATISCLPCQHTSARTATDKDTTLWCSWAVSSGDKSVFFGGDTGYRAVPHLPAGEDDYSPKYDHLPRNPDFKKIGLLRGPFDLGLIPIGAYKPRHCFSYMHANPYDAVEIFKDTACRRAVGIHWGTWVLTAEDVEEPPRMLREALKRSGIEEEGVFDVVALGESREY